MEQRSRSPSPSQSAQSLPFQLRRFPGRFFTGAKRRLLPSTPGSMKKKKHPPEHLQLAKVDASLMINFPLVSHSPTIPTRTPAVINFPKLNASPTHYMKHAPVGGEFLVPGVGTDEQRLLQQLPPPLQPQPGIWLPASGDPNVAGFTGEFQQQPTDFSQQQQQQQQQPSSSRFVGASLSSLLAPLRVFGGRSSSTTRQQSPVPPVQPQLQPQPLLPQQQPVLDPNVVQPVQPVMKRNLFGEKRELPQPPSAVYFPTASTVPGTIMQPTLPTWPEETQPVDYSVAGPKPEIQPTTYSQAGFERMPSQDSLPGGRILPQPQPSSQPGAGTLMMMRSMELPRVKARERMKIRSSTWTDETYLPEDSGHYIVGTGPRRRQPPIPTTIKRPSSAGILMTPAVTSQRPKPPLIAAAFGLGASSSSTGSHPARRITPPVPRAARRKQPIHQHSFHSDGAAEIAKPDDDDDDEDWC